MGMTSMRERAELIDGTIEFLKQDGGGALVRLSISMAPEQQHAGA